MAAHGQAARSELWQPGSTGLKAALAQNATSSSVAQSQYTLINERLAKARNKKNSIEEADALYDLAKAHFEDHELLQAEELMRQALTVEQNLNRPSALLRTQVALASILAAARRYDDSLSMYRQALQLGQKEEMDDQVDTIINNMGALAMVAHKIDEADKFFRQANELSEKHNNNAGQANALVNLSVISRLKKDYSGALNYLDKATSLVSQSDDSGLRASVFMESGRAYADFGAYVPAIACYQRAQNIFEEDGDEISRAKALTSLGKIYLSQRKPDQARSALKTAFEILSQHQNGTVFIECQIALGAAEADLGNFTDAEKMHSQALESAIAARDIKNRLQALSELAYDYFLQGTLEKALNRFSEAYNIIREYPQAKDEDKAPLLRDIGMCLHALGQTAAAIRYFSEAAQLFEQLGDLRNEVLAYNSLAVAYLDSGAPKQFEIYFRKAKDLLGKRSDKVIDAYLNYNYAQFCLIDSRLADAFPLYEEALKDYRSLHDLKGECKVLSGLGFLYFSLGRYGKAEEYYKQASGLANQVGSMEEQWDCYLGLGKVYKAVGNSELAEDNLRQAVLIVEKERAQLTRDSFKTFNIDFRQDCFSELIDLLVKTKRSSEALEVAEKGRARAFLDLLEGRSRGRFLKEPSARLSLVEGESTPQTSGLTTIAMGTVNSQRQNATERGVEVLPRPVSLIEPSVISNFNVKPPSLEEIRELVKQSGSYVVEYYALPQRVLSWIIKPTGEIVLAPPVVVSRSELTQRIKETYLSIISPPKSPKEAGDLNRKRQQNLKDLHKLLIEPLSDYLPKSSNDVVTFVPHGPIFSVPFAALISPTHRFLIEEHTLAYAPAIGVLRATHKLEQETLNEKNTLLAFGNPITKGTIFLGRLPYAEREVKKIASLFGPNASTIEVGASATKKLFQTLAPKNTVLHLATHGLVDEEHPMDSALVLAQDGTDDGLLTVRDILLLPPLRARLIVLSACQTGRGKITGDGVVGLSRAFIIAGTPSILVSQWNVDDVMTEYQMEAMYKTYLKGQSKAKSLREAQLKTIAFMEKAMPAISDCQSYKQNPLTVRANPRYWAAFQLIGEYK